MIVITQSLWLGTEEEASGAKDVFFVRTPGDAVHTIAEGATAVISADGWEDQAREILKRLHAPTDHIDWLITFAKGEVAVGALEFDGKL